MRASDIRQLLWWLSGGLGVAAAVVGVVTLLRPPESRAQAWLGWGGGQVLAALTPQEDRRGAGLDFERDYGATFRLRIDGQSPAPAAEPTPEPAAEPEPRKLEPLAHYIELTNIWTRSVAYRRRSDPSPRPHPYEVAVGESLPPDHAPGIRPPPKLLRIEADRRPFRAVFLVRGKEEVLLVPHDDVLLLPAAATLGPEGAEPYRGPSGAVVPLRRPVPAAEGIRYVPREGAYVVGPDVQALFQAQADSLVRGIAWNSTPKGIAVVKIARGSLAEQLLRQAGGKLVQEGDVIVSVNGVPVRSYGQVVSYFRQHPVQPGQIIRVEILRLGKRIVQTIRVPKQSL